MNVFEGFPDVSLKDIITETPSGIDLAPSSLDLVGVEPYLYSINERASLLKNAIKPVISEYKYILIDTPPSMGQFVINGIVAADRIVLTLDSSIFARNGLESLNCIFSDIKEITGRSRSADMAILTRAGALCERKAPFEEMRLAFWHMITGKGTDDDEKARQNSIEEEIKGKIKEVCTVPYDSEVYRAQTEGMPLAYISPESPAAVKYNEISEIIARWK